jgi:hypothetical protein
MYLQLVEAEIIFHIRLRKVPRQVTKESLVRWAFGEGGRLMLASLAAVIATASVIAAVAIIAAVISPIIFAVAVAVLAGLTARLTAIITAAAQTNKQTNTKQTGRKNSQGATHEIEVRGIESGEAKQRMK